LWLLASSSVGGLRIGAQPPQNQANLYKKANNSPQASDILMDLISAHDLALQLEWAVSTPKGYALFGIQ